MEIQKAIALFLKGYFSTCQRSPRTIRAYTIDLEQFATFLGFSISIGDIRPEDMEAWAAELKEAAYASASVRRKFASLKVFFNFCIRRELLESSPLWKIRLDLAPERRLPKTLSLDEVNRLLARARSEVERHSGEFSGVIDAAFLALRDLALVELLFATGIRIGELVALRLEDYRPTEDAFLIRGKGGRQRIAFLPDARSRGTIGEYIECRERISSDHGMVFVNSRRGALSTQRAAGIIRSLACLAGISRRITPHMFRHTIATLLLQNGADIRVVQEFLGHASITTTQKYTHVSLVQLRSDLEMFHPNHRSR
jgi:integrase/recombinase XerD